MLFSDLGSGTAVYDPNVTWDVDGFGHGPDFPSISVAEEFIISSSGIFSVSQIDLAVTSTGLADTFYGSIWTESGGAPTTQVDNAYWSVDAVSGPCCNLVSISGVTNVALNGNEAYFLVLGPLASNTRVEFHLNNQNVFADEMYSTNGGTTWNDNGPQLPGAFDILGSTASTTVPEPTQLCFILLGLGVIRIAEVLRRGPKEVGINETTFDG